MAEKTTGYYREFIIPPGETLKEILDDRGMTQKDLAARTGFSEKQISQIIKDGKAITHKFAKRLEYALSIDASFWDNLESLYRQKMIAYEQENEITDEEKSILKHLKEIIEYYKKRGILPDTSSKNELVINLRKIFCISNLTSIPDLTICGAFRTAATSSINIYVMYAWLKLCEYETKSEVCENGLDKEKLRRRLPEILSLTTADAPKKQERLTEIFHDCGIVFRIVKNFRGAPVHGYIKQTYDKTILCMTIRNKYADIFWFTLIHEIAHILNDDFKTELIDFDFRKTDMEMKADKFAAEQLIASNLYEEFVQKGIFSRESVLRFSSEISRHPGIVVGRLQKDEYIEYSELHDLKMRYEWEQ